VDITGLFVFIFIGALAGWLAGTVMKDGGFGLLGNSIIGIVGGVAGVFFFQAAGNHRRRFHRFHGDSYCRSRAATIRCRPFQEYLRILDRLTRDLL